MYDFEFQKQIVEELRKLYLSDLFDKEGLFTPYIRWKVGMDKLSFSENDIIRMKKEASSQLLLLQQCYPNISDSIVDMVKSETAFETTTDEVKKWVFLKTIYYDLTLLSFVISSSL